MARSRPEGSDLPGKPELKDFLRKECGEPRINTPSGSVCHNGHGRIHPPIPLKVHRVLLAIIKGVKPCKYSKAQKCYSVKGDDRLFKKVDKWASEFSGVVYITAYKGLKLLRLVPLSFEEMQKPRFGVVYHKVRERRSREA